MKKINILFLLFMATVGCKAQTNTNMLDKLQNKRWFVRNDEVYSFEYSKTNMKYFVKGVELIIPNISREYHFSDKKCSESVFDHSKVGNVGNWQYILTGKDCCIIQFIDDKHFKFGVVGDNGYVSLHTYQTND